MKRFADLYEGNGTAAAIAAGYTPASARFLACKLLKDPRIVTIIRAREEKTVTSIVKTRLQRQEWLQKVADDEQVEMKDRLKAMEMLCRSEGDFLDRLQVDTRHTVKLPEGMTADDMRTWARRKLPSETQEEEDAEVVGGSTH